MDKEMDKLDFMPGEWGEGYQIVESLRRTGSPMKLLTIKPYFLGLNRVQVGKDAHFPLHRHTEYELIIVESGPYQCTINGYELSLEQDQALLVQPGDEHEVFLKKGQQHIIIQFSLQNSGSNKNANLQVFTNDIEPLSQLINIEKQLIDDIIQRLEYETEGERPFSAQVQDSLMEEIFWILLRSMPGSAVSTLYKRESRDELFLKSLNSALVNHMNQKLTVEDLAGLLQYSKSAITRKCRHLLGDTPEQIIMKSKIRNAVILLSQSDRPIKEICYQLGFKNPYHFSRVFKRYTGRPPSQMRPNKMPQAD